MFHRRRGGAISIVEDRIWCRRRIGGGIESRIGGPNLRAARGIHLPLSGGHWGEYRFVFCMGLGGGRYLVRLMELRLRKWRLCRMEAVRRVPLLMPS